MSKKWFALLILPVALLLLLGASCSKDEEAAEEEDATSNWLVYSDEEAGFDLKYPEGAAMGELTADNQNELLLNVEVTKLDATEFPLGYDQTTAKSDREALANGEFGEPMTMSVDDSQKIVKLSDKSGKEWMVLGRFDICDVTFERIVVFYNNNYQVLVTLYGPADQIRDSMPEYFTINTANCGDKPIWDNQAGFYKKVSAGEGSEVANEWYSDFDEIVGTIEFK